MNAQKDTEGGRSRNARVRIRTHLSLEAVDELLQVSKLLRNVNGMVLRDVAARHMQSSTNVGERAHTQLRPPTHLYWMALLRPMM